MRGLTPGQYLDMMIFIKNNHRFGMPPRDQKYPHKSIKYVDTVTDMRFGDMWSVTFRGLTPHYSFTTNLFADKTAEKVGFDSLYDWIMAYLKGEWEPSDKLAKMMDNEQRS